MATSPFVRQEIIDGDSINIADIQCPKCANRTLVLGGQAQIPQREVIEDGVVVTQIPGRYEDGGFNLEQIDCLNCCTRFIVRDHILFELERENLDLRQRLVAAGEKVEGTSYPN